MIAAWWWFFFTCLFARLYVYLVISSAIVRDPLDARSQRGDDLLVEQTDKFCGGVVPVDPHDASVHSAGT